MLSSGCPPESELPQMSQSKKKRESTDKPYHPVSRGITLEITKIVHAQQEQHNWSFQEVPQDLTNPVVQRRKSV